MPAYPEASYTICLEPDQTQISRKNDRNQVNTRESSKDTSNATNQELRHYMIYRFFSAISRYWLWVLLALPAAGMLSEALGAESARVYHQLLHPSGEFAARFMIIAMMASPLALVFKGRAFPRWLVRNRRYFGVAAFGYAALHTALYLLDEASIASVLADLPKVYIWTGWAAFVVFIPLAVTSSDVFVRILGPKWKRLQRWVYVAAVLTLVHWAALHDWGGWAPALVHFGPLGALSIYRLWNWNLRRKGRAPEPA